VKEWEKGAQVVIGIRKKINDTPLMIIIRKSFYIIFKKLANIDMPLDAGSFCLLDRKVMEVINNLPERNRFFRGLRAWVGFKVAEVVYERKSRIRGTSKNNIVDYIRDSQRGLLGFSFVPLDLMTTFGLLLTLISFIFLILYLAIVLFLGNPIRAQIPLFMAIIFFGGIQMLAISILGKYIQIIFEEVKQRPTYIIDEILNNHKK
jgi:dolichol-phosphate mannosyltransferase